MSLRHEKQGFHIALSTEAELETPLIEVISTEVLAYSLSFFGLSRICDMEFRRTSYCNHWEEVRKSVFIYYIFHVQVLLMLFKSLHIFIVCHSIESINETIEGIIL